MVRRRRHIHCGRLLIHAVSLRGVARPGDHTPIAIPENFDCGERRTNNCLAGSIIESQSIVGIGMSV